MLPLFEGDSEKLKKINECILELSAGKGKKVTRVFLSYTFNYIFYHANMLRFLEAA